MSDRTCSIEACERLAESRGWCSMHYKRWLKHGDPDFVGVGGFRRGISGLATTRWRGDEISYSGAHMRVRARKGSASQYRCSCGSPAKHWSYDHADPNEKVEIRLTRKGTAIKAIFSADPEHYVPRCVPCHKLFDQQMVLGGRR